MRENIKDLGQFKDYILDKLDRKFNNIVDSIMAQLTEHYDEAVNDYKNINYKKHDKNSLIIDIENPTTNIEDYIEEDVEGKILIDNKNYKIDKDAFKIVHFITQREIVSTLRNTISEEYKIYFRGKNKTNSEADIREVIRDIAPFFWENIHKKNRRDARIQNLNNENRLPNNVINYPTKDDYVYSCIHSSIIIKYSDFISEFKRFQEEGKKV